MLPRSLKEFIHYFSKLPGIGLKSSERIGYSLITRDDDFMKGLSESIRKLKTGIKTCSVCGNIDDTDPCAVCTDGSRDNSLICVVESAMDIHYIESTNSYHGLYHVLGGVISPLNGVTPKDLQIEQLMDRVQRGGVKEVMFATSATTEGDTTVLYIREILKKHILKITHLARGIPVGTGLQYAGSGSLSQAIRSREEVK